MYAGRRMPPPMSTGAASGAGSSSQAQCSMPAIAMTPQTAAGTTSFTVSNRKNAAVNHAATSGAQPGIGMRSRNSGFASSALVTMVSRPPVGAPGR